MLYLNFSYNFICYTFVSVTNNCKEFVLFSQFFTFLHHLTLLRGNNNLLFPVFLSRHNYRCIYCGYSCYIMEIVVSEMF